MKKLVLFIVFTFSCIYVECIGQTTDISVKYIDGVSKEVKKIYLQKECELYDRYILVCILSTPDIYSYFSNVDSLTVKDRIKRQVDSINALGLIWTFEMDNVSFFQKGSNPIISKKEEKRNIKYANRYMRESGEISEKQINKYLAKKSRFLSLSMPIQLNNDYYLVYIVDHTIRNTPYYFIDIINYYNTELHIVKRVCSSQR